MIINIVIIFVKKNNATDIRVILIYSYRKQHSLYVHTSVRIYAYKTTVDKKITYYSGVYREKIPTFVIRQYFITYYVNWYRLNNCKNSNTFECTVSFFYIIFENFNGNKIHFQYHLVTEITNYFSRLCSV